MAIIGNIPYFQTNPYVKIMSPKKEAAMQHCGALKENMPGTSFCAHLSAPENLPVYRDKKEPPPKKRI